MSRKTQERHDQTHVIKKTKKGRQVYNLEALLERGWATVYFEGKDGRRQKCGIIRSKKGK